MIYSLMAKYSRNSVMASSCSAASGISSLIFTDDGTHESISKTNSEVYRNILYANVQIGNVQYI